MATCVEICAGAGGQALGLEKAGFEPLALVEIDRQACDILRYNCRNEIWLKGTSVRSRIKTQRSGSACGKRSLSSFLSRRKASSPLLVSWRATLGKQLGQDDDRKFVPANDTLIQENSEHWRLI